MIVRQVPIVHGRWLRGARKFCLTRPFPYRFGPYAGTVPDGRVIDGASSPRFFWRVIDPWDPDILPAVTVHDDDYKLGLTSRADADRKMGLAMELCAVAAWKRVAVHRAVKMFGWASWNQHRKEERVVSKLYYFKPHADCYERCAAEYATTGRYPIPGVACCPGHPILTLPGRLLVQHDMGLMLDVADGAEAQCDKCGEIYNVERLHLMREKRLRAAGGAID